MKTATRPDVYAQVTARIVEQLEAGVRPWFRPWNTNHKAGSISRPLRNTGQPYQGISVLVLWLTAFEKGYTCPIWLTFNQAREAGGFVKKGEKGTPSSTPTRSRRRKRTKRRARNPPSGFRT